MIFVGIGFKLAVVPFHMWTPDVYEGAPVPTAAFVATLSKGGVVALLLRLVTQIDVSRVSALFLALGAVAIASMLAGNLLALWQSNVKRVLAYSSIAHLGYVLVAFLASGELRSTAVTFYMVAYFITTLGAFGIVTALSGRERDMGDIDDYRGLFWHRPWLAGVFTAMLLSLAGMPLTAGFIGKFYLAAAGVGSELWLLVLVLVIASVIGLFYYLRIATALYLRPAEREGAIFPAPSLTWHASLTLAALTLLLVWLGVFPGPLVDLIEATVGGLG
jgi:NADH-quinone oxidoreductase subunit N